MSSTPSSPIHAFQDSSPESSPPLEPIDSSPPSSPVFQSATLSPPTSPGLAHPYAASTKAVRPPRLYEKRGIFAHDENNIFDEDDDVVTNRAQSSSTWNLSPQKKRVDSHYHTRTLSTASTSSSVTDFALGKQLEPRLLLFGASRPTKRSISMDSRDELAGINLSDDEEASVDHGFRPLSHIDREKRIWDTIITKAIDSANGRIYLQQEGLISSGLSFIPPSIADLASLVVLPSKEKPVESKTVPVTSPRARPLIRSVTLPRRNNIFADPEPLLAKSASMTIQLPPGNPEASPLTNEVNLCLGNNVITKLPVELFRLTNLTILSMRNNLLTHIPPQIALLSNLRELNIACNRIVYLPVEMLEMKLEALMVDKNPWLEPPTLESSISLERTETHSSSGEADAPPSERATVSKTAVNFSVPSLTECCLRVLLAPYSEPSQESGRYNSGIPHPPPHPRTRLEATYELPLSHIDHYPVYVVNTLRACVPQAVTKPDPHMQASPSKRARRSSTQSLLSSELSDVFRTDTPDDDDADRGEKADVGEIHPGIGTCMSPRHPRHARPVFIYPAEQRFQWVRIIAGQNTKEEVPVLWRGCMPGCLSFLDQEHGNAANTKGMPPVKKSACIDDTLSVSQGSGDGFDEDDLEPIDLGGHSGLEDDFD
ncbi:hypothetical protein BDY19DRAFT_1059398 [Irpex rosettiformis]|uniref:Uncharacterized protein n=1 Tax=Irpex rosettiformis TaxID=378272 RepID=A0ACB8TUX9_9APHY|nr:hypothetical protein BDY19DRAFT_1059398 [Irpex rosettiformis]